MQLLAVDPGKRTGLAKLTGDWNFDSWEEDDQMKLCSELWSYVDGYDAVICENFIIGGKPGAVTAQPYSLEIIGMLRWACYINDVPFITQNPSDRKTMSKEFLKKLGWYKGTKGEFEGHADDAAMHLGTYLMARQDQQFLRRLYS